IEGEDLTESRDGDEVMCLTWRVSDPAQEACRDAYRMAVESMVTTLGDASLLSLIEMWCGGETHKNAFAEWSADWWRLMAAYDRNCERFTAFHGDRLGVSVAMLFFEYVVRARAGESLPRLIADKRVQSLFAGSGD